MLMELKEWLLIVVEKYAQFGPLFWFGMVFLESLLPIIPLIIVVFANLYAFESFIANKAIALVLTIILSTLATTLGSIVVFLFHRKVTKKFVHKKIKDKDHGWFALFIISAIPFTPTSIINFYYGVSKVSDNTFIKVTLVSKVIMVTTLTLTGKLYQQAIEKNPYLSIIGFVVTILLYVVAKKLEKTFSNMRSEKLELQLLS